MKILNPGMDVDHTTVSFSHAELNDVYIPFFDILVDATSGWSNLPTQHLCPPGRANALPTHADFTYVLQCVGRQLCLLRCMKDRRNLSRAQTERHRVGRNAFAMAFVATFSSAERCRTGMCVAPLWEEGQLPRSSIHAQATKIESPRIHPPLRNRKKWGRKYPPTSRRQIHPRREDRTPIIWLYGVGYVVGRRELSGGTA